MLLSGRPSKEHFPVWVKMRSHMRQNKSFGIFHETFKVRAKIMHCIRKLTQEEMHCSVVPE